jgi:hypothetical protein
MPACNVIVQQLSSDDVEVVAVVFVASPLPPRCLHEAN